uniref:RING-CH-type domain-containing protein n=1 Tax=Solanum tuberosum TaxID=4113 RepID=M1CYC9_SOLTU
MSYYDSSSSSLVPPLIDKPSKVDLEAGNIDQIQCRICLENDGEDFIAPCKCKGSSKYVHRECLDQWRAVKEGFAFSHCTTCKAPFYLRVNDLQRKWRTLKFRFFVTTDILFIFLAVQLVLAALGYLVYVIDTHQKSWLLLHWGFGSELGFYYICGALLFFALVGISGCFLTCFDESVRDDLSQPCQNALSCCSCTSLCADCHTRRPHTGGGGDQSGIPGLLVVAIIVIGLFALLGMFYSVLVATMVVQRIWQRHYHILEKRMLTKEYVVEDVGEVACNDWSPPPLPQQHVQKLESLGLV